MNKARVVVPRIISGLMADVDLRMSICECRSADVDQWMSICGCRSVDVNLWMSHRARDGPRVRV
jgi:hypothetical protein